MEQQHFEALYPDTARFSDIQKVAGFIKNGKSSQLLSIPGVGRGTVLRMLVYNKRLRLKHLGEAEKTTHFVFVNFSEIRNRSLHDAMKFLFLSLTDSLRERKKVPEYEKINKLFKEALAFKDELVLFQALKEAIDYLSLEKKYNIVFLFDRFEEFIPVVTNGFFNNLRTLRSRAKYKFSVVFSLNRPLEDLLEPVLLFDFYEFVAGNHVYLSLRDDVTTDFRISYIEKITGKKVPPSLLKEIVKEAAGIGKLVKLSVEILLSEKTPPNTKNLNEFLFSKKQIKEAVSEICRSLTPSEQTALIKEKFASRLAKQDPASQESEVWLRQNDELEYLKCVGIISSNKIQIPFFDQHIRTHAKEFSQRSQKIIFDTNTNTIKLGETVLSDQLTSSEFKLLSFLLSSRETIVTRDEIIAATWSDVKSTAGITDQAVDQLIFRLRRKIEEDPNHPGHLLTVKGRGFKFVP